MQTIRIHCPDGAAIHTDHVQLCDAATHVAARDHLRNEALALLAFQELLDSGDDITIDPIGFCPSSGQLVFDRSAIAIDAFCPIVFVAEACDENKACHHCGASDTACDIAEELLALDAFAPTVHALDASFDKAALVAAMARIIDRHL